MNKVLGGFKNMLRQWRINLKRKKAKEEKKKHPKAKSFAYSLLALLYAPFGYLFNFNSKREKTTKLKLEPLFDEIELKLDYALLEENINFEKIDQKVATLKREVAKTTSKTKSKKTNQYYQKRLEKIVMKKDEVKKQIIKSSMKEEKKISNIGSINVEKEKNELGFRPSPFVKGPVLTKETSNFHLKQPSSFVKPQAIKSKVIIQQTNLNFIKEANNELKKDYELLSKIEEKITKTTVYNHFYDLENELKLLRQKIEKLKEKYKELEGSFDKSTYIKEDHYKLLKDGKSIDIILEQIEADFKAISLKKKTIFYERKQPKQDNEEKKKAPVNLEEKPKKENKVDLETIKAQELVVENIIEQNRYLEEYFQKITKATNRKKTLFSSLLNFSKSIVNFAVSLFPISLFKNKLLGSLVSTIMLNNSIKTMRKMVDPSLEMKYLLLEEYKNHQQMVIDIYKISNNSLMELAVLKKQLISFYNSNEAKLLLEQITTIEESIIKQLELLKLKDKKISKVLVKIKKES